MFKHAGIPLLFAAAAVAIPEPLVDRNGVVNCQAVTDIVTIMHQQNVATPFCSSYLHIPHPTTTTTITSTPCAVTTTTTISSTDTVTTTSVSTVSAVTTVYPVVAISTTSTCSLSATVAQSAYNNQKRGVTTTTKCTTSTTSSTTSKTTSTTKCTTTSTPTTAKTTTSSAPTTTKCTTTTTPASVSAPPIGVPTCLTKFVQSDVSSACQCLSIPTQTYTSTVSTTLTPSTITSTVCSTAHSTVTTTVTTTTFTSTYSGTQYYTSTFTVLPPPSSTVTASAYPTQTFGAYTGLDFSGQDIQNFFCYNGGAAPPAPFTGTTCTGFTDCINECAYYNANNLGSSSNTTCGAALYSAPQDGSSGSCYLKTGINGCGSPRDTSSIGVILPLIATDPQ